MMPSVGQLLLVLAIVLVIFGAKRVPGMMKDLGQGMKSFRDGMKEGDDTAAIEKKDPKEDA